MLFVAVNSLMIRSQGHATFTHVGCIAIDYIGVETNAPSDLVICFHVGWNKEGRETEMSRPVLWKINQYVSVLLKGGGGGGGGAIIVIDVVCYEINALSSSS